MARLSHTMNLVCRAPRPLRAGAALRIPPHALRDGRYADGVRLDAARELIREERARGVRQNQDRNQRGGKEREGNSFR
jgi:hypothetical protein